MNLNKYHSSGRLYTAKESIERARLLLTVGTYLVRGYDRRNVGQQARINPFRNEAKRQERRLKSIAKGMARREFA